MFYNSSAFKKGMRDSIPVFIGYFAVSITVGIKAASIGLSAFQAAFMSLTNLTSAGQAAALDIMNEGGSFTEIILSQLVINLRYLLMGAALSIKLKNDSTTGERLLFSYGITDEVFGLASAQPSPLSPWYTIGCWVTALPGWVSGTFIGAIAGNIFPTFITSALSLGLYAMFIAVIIPASKKNLFIAALVLFSMMASYFVSLLIPEMTSGLRVIILTILISNAAAVIKPVEEETND